MRVIRTGSADDNFVGSIVLRTQAEVNPPVPDRSAFTRVLLATVTHSARKRDVLASRKARPIL
jgi:hypothetical protein